MSLGTLNGAPVLGAWLAMPRLGVWTADVEVDAEQAPEGSVELTLAGVKFLGTSYRAGQREGVVRAKVVGGAGRLAVEVPPKFYRGPTVGLVLRDLLSECRESLSASADQRALAKSLPAWSRARGRASEAIRALAAHVGVAWRVLADGTVWFGEETWPTVSLEHAVLNADPEAGRLELDCETPSLVPGVMLAGKRIERVEVNLTEGALRVVALVQDARGADDPARALEAIIRSVTAGSLYLGQFPAKVIAQNADGTLELKPEDSRLPGMTRVPIRYGIPGVTAKVAAGARIGIEFESGDPTRPVATVWESASIVELVFDGGSKAVARVEDHVDASSSVVAPSPLSMSTWMTGVTSAINTLAPGSLLGTPSRIGEISSGNTKLKA